MKHCVTRACAMALMALAIASCGKQHEAESVVKKFIADNAAVKDYSVEFQRMDSTTHVSDSLIDVMKRAADRNKFFKKGISYEPNSKPGKYIYLPARIYVDKDTLSQTFYLDMEMTHVISFK